MPTITEYGWTIHRDLRALLASRRAVAGIAARSGWSLCEISRAREYVDLAACSIQDAETVCWPPDVYDGAANGCEAFGEQSFTMEMRPLKAQLWVTSVYDRWAAQCYQIGEPAVCLAELLDPVMAEVPGRGRQPALLLHAFFLAGAPDRPLAERVYIRTVPPLVADLKPGIDDTWLDTVARLEFMKSRFARADLGELPRPERRRYRKQTGRDPDIRVIRLRRPEPGLSPEGRSERNYECQWWVAGHWRQQYRGPNRPRQATYVQPYIKGPPDKPLKASRPTLTVVSR